MAELTAKYHTRTGRLLQGRLLFCLGFILFCHLAWFMTAAPQAEAAPARVVYGFDREFPPFSYEAPGGKPTGFEVEILEAILKGENITLSYRPLQWENIATELSAGTISLTTGMVRTEQRAKLYLFSGKPTFHLHIKLFTKIYNRQPSIQKYKGTRVSVDQNTFSHRLLQHFGGVHIQPMPNRADGLKALYKDQVNAYCGPVQNTYYYINKLKYSGITTVGTPLGIAPMHIAVSRERGDLTRLVNAGFDRIMKSGEYHRIYRKWFVRELTQTDINAMHAAAVQAAVPAYTPYGGKPMGAALLTATGKVFSACTVENADKTLSLSAARAVLARAVSDGEFEIRALMLTDQNGEVVAPTTTDLQAAYEFGPGTLIVGPKKGGGADIMMVSQLLAKPVVVSTTPIIAE
ncbi:transporter substrate-binding domain-containing protein [Desulfovibrio sp. OttesenSCG-928-G15]|nr:transporter substrate-binding domain-containing protein [Desulfovibrio sp. OttesenSCG-928-G15]